MEGLISFLTSQEGKYVCYALLVVGASDIILPKFVFAKKLAELQKSILSTMWPEQKKPIEDNIKKMKFVIANAKFFGMAMIAFAIFGLTR